MYSKTRLQFTLVTKNSYNKEIYLYIECARNTISPFKQAISQRYKKAKKKKKIDGL